MAGPWRATLPPSPWAAPLRCCWPIARPHTRGLKRTAPRWPTRGGRWSWTPRTSRHERMEWWGVCGIGRGRAWHAGGSAHSWRGTGGAVAAAVHTRSPAFLPTCSHLLGLLPPGRRCPGPGSRPRRPGRLSARCARRAWRPRPAAQAGRVRARGGPPALRGGHRPAGEQEGLVVGWAVERGWGGSGREEGVPRRSCARRPAAPPPAARPPLHPHPPHPFPLLRMRGHR